MAIKPVYAKMIYEGRKNWEFRTCPPPVMRLLYIYESAPVSAITGTVLFRCKVEGYPQDVWETVKHGKTFSVNYAGIRESTFYEYVGNHATVAALRVDSHEKFEKPIKIAFKPPMNWCTLTAASYRRVAEIADGLVNFNQ